MSALMARIRITIDCDEAYKRAFLSRANAEGVSPQELFERVVREVFPDDLARVHKLMGGDDPPKPPPKKPAR